MPHNRQKTILKGTGASPGICMGQAYIVDKDGVNVIKRYPVSKEQISSEINRFKTAVKEAVDELSAIIKNTSTQMQGHNDILESQVILLTDKMLYERTIETITQNHINAEWALKKVITKLRIGFQTMPQAYFTERLTELQHVQECIMRKLTGAETVSINNLNHKVILVAKELSPAETSQIQLEKVMGFITEGGGAASHTGIIARTLGLPAVVGVEKAVQSIDNDDDLILDGITGKIIVRPNALQLEEYKERQLKYEDHRTRMNLENKVPACTIDQERIFIMGNIEAPEEASLVNNLGGDGIGLYRTEFQYLQRAGFPEEEQLFEKYKETARLMAPNPVTIRTLDINGDKALTVTHTDEVNPALGLRAIRYCLKKPEVFKTQLRAILRAAFFGNVRLLLPMICSYDEIAEAKQIIRSASESLEQEKKAHQKDIKVGIMVEVPSAVIMADIMAQEVDFFSIGTNDLIQYSLAIDRGNRQVAYLYQPLHPAIIRMIKHVSEVAAAQGIPCVMCGEMASYAIHIPVLLGLGIHEFSVNPQSIPLVKRTISLLIKKGCQDLIRDILKMKTTEQISGLIREIYGDALAEYIYNE